MALKHFSRITASAVFAAVLLAGLAVPSARAAGLVFYVDNGNSSCSDANVGDAAHPFCTIGKGASVATAGQTVMVSSGTYGEQVSVAHSGTAGSPIIFTTAPGASVTVTGGARGFSIWQKRYITVNGFTITGTSSYGIYVSSFGSAGSTDHITITNNHVSSSGLPQQFSTAAGIYLQDTNDSVVSGNTTNNNTDNGISLVGTSTGVTVAHNVSYENASGWLRAANGIGVIAPGNTVVDNITRDNEDSGVQIYPGGDNTLVANNVSYNNGDHGLDNRNVAGGRVIGNTVYHNCTSGINVEGTSANYTVENNIAVDNGVYAAYHGISCNRGVGNIRVWDSATSSTTADYNLVYLSTSGFEYGWGVSYPSLEAMSAATGQESHGLQVDPLFVEPLDADLHLSASSPAIDSANSAVSGEQAVDLSGSPRVDDPDTPNTGSGPRAYDDRGASEFDARPIASLTVTPSSATAPAKVTADASASTDTDLTGIATYAFDFGDGTVIGPQASSLATHTYNGAGAYVVTVTVADSGGKSSQKKANVSIADAVPSAKLNVTPSSGTAPQQVVADASGSSDPDTTPIASYSFNFGDGSPVIGPQTSSLATHTYNGAGAYVVTVTVADSGGNWSQKQANVSIAANTPPSAKLNVTPSIGTAPRLVVADASGSSDPDTTPIASYTFDFGDGSPVVGPQSTANASHIFTKPGIYSVNVTVKDTANVASTASSTVTISSVNLVKNPGFQVNSLGWTVWPTRTGCTLGRARVGLRGTWGAVIQNTVAKAQTCGLDDSPNWVSKSSAGVYTAKIWVRGARWGVPVTLLLSEYYGRTRYGYAYKRIILKTTWQLLTVSYRIKRPGSVLSMNASVYQGKGVALYADDISITYI